MFDQPIILRFVKTKKWGSLAIKLLKNRQISYREVEPELIEFKLEGYVSTEILDTIARLGEHNRQLIIGGEEVEWWTAFQWTGCYSQSHLKPIPTYCFNPKRTNRTKSVWEGK